MNIPVEAGDHFYVRSRPAKVNVFGAVYNQNSFVQDPESTVGDYLRTAGGPNREADIKHAFVILANGSVVPRKDYKNAQQKGSFNGMILEPGDTVVVAASGLPSCEEALDPSASTLRL